jgi:BatD DUF11 like domain
MRRLLEASLGAACLIAAAPAHAQARLETRVSSQRVEVGEPFRIELEVKDPAGDVQNPNLTAPPGLTVRGRGLMPQTSVMFFNGRMQKSVSYTASWTLVASKPGSYRIGPPTIEVDGKPTRGNVVPVEVLPQGSKPRGGGLGFPFDFFGMPGAPAFPGFPGGPELEPELPQFPPEYALDRAKDPLAFVVTKAKPTEVVLGEGLRVDVIAYGGRGDYQGIQSTEPSRDGFIAYDSKDDSRGYIVPIGGNHFVAKRVNSWVLFPLRTGSLKIGSASFEFLGRNYCDPRKGVGLKRESQPITIIVRDPPLEGRPAGYRLGDVGRFQVSASVEPRTITEGAAVSVAVKLEGTGNVPASLPLPGQNGVEWAEPAKSEHLEAIEGKVQGYRTFNYVVKVDRVGSVDLGEIALSYYDPAKRRYEVTRAALGKIQVKPDPNKATRPTPPQEADPLRGLLPARAELGEGVEPVRHLADRPGFWLALLFGPLAVLGLGAATRLGQRLIEQRRQRREQPMERASRELDGAKAARAKEPSRAAASAERAVLFAIESATALKARGVLRSELGRELERREVKPELSSRIVELLDRCEDLRFSGAPPEVANQVVDAASEIVHAFARGRWKS